MSTYYFPISNDLAENLLKNGIPLPPPPQPPMIHALRSLDGAKALASLFYGSNHTILRVEGDFDLYDQLPENLSSTVFLMSPVPASSLSRVGRLRDIHEVVRGVAPQEGVISQRTYEDIYGRRFAVWRHADESRPFSLRGPLHKGDEGYPPLFKRINERSWQKAELALDIAVGENIAALRDLPVIVLKGTGQYGDPEIPTDRFLQRGLCGVDVDVWEVDQHTVDRGNWGGWIEEPGWYWQRMDVAEVHGPFSVPEAAVVDIGVNFDAPGIAPSSSSDHRQTVVPRQCP